MIDYFDLSAEDCRRVLQQASARCGLPPQAIEKDLWVSTVLQVFFSLPVSDRLIFKGGTSLSKVWHLIERFSEDIDLAIDPSLFGFDGDLTKRQVKKLRKASSIFVRDELREQLDAGLERCGLSEVCRVFAEVDGEGDDTYPEPRRLFVEYESVFREPLGYLLPTIQLEVGARSLIEPYKQMKIVSMVEELFPSIRTSVVSSGVATALASKTFLEKVFLIHELFSVEGRGVSAERKSRHLYDLSRMMNCDFAVGAVGDAMLWESIRRHREVFTSVRGVDYAPDVRRRIVLVPREDIVDEWRADYERMCTAMIFGERPSFDDLMVDMRILEARFRAVNG